MDKIRLIFDPDTKVLIDTDIAKGIKNDDGTFSYEDIPDTYVMIEYQEFHNPILVDGRIIEGKTEDEFLEEDLMASILPSKEESDKAEFEIKVLTLLSEMELF